MKILVFSDSHTQLTFMRKCIQAVKPDAIVHLGDHYEDGQIIALENPYIPFHQVPGNCDRYRCPVSAQQMLCYSVCGIKLFMTHGHCYHVKQTTYSLLAEARKLCADAVLYGHTHIIDCHRESDGMWVLNPGSCGSENATAGVIQADDGKISACQIIRQADIG